ncbi:50S ribosomal protein L3 [Holospora curviuscula]|uniref:50S ribosomal protein L3 n=1 Tax=Holospora curviuscula TaxID=1082868 RepID=A0A2S5R8J1_9PROT|nr:50S ribosomal protein L3 [Holospora curviuscula]PPE03659.1 50S ribosomal protein L3 [Holospora curviuscula]
MKQRVGLIARKIGMTRVVEKNKIVAATVLQVDSCVVRCRKEGQRISLQIGAKAKKKVSRPLQGYFQKQGVPFFSKLCEFIVSEDGIIPEGSVLKASHFTPGQWVDVTGTSIGKGFSGGMKRWGFRGLPASHGTSVSHRSHGSTGHRKDPGKVFKGKKMAGHMGCVTVTKQNLRVLETLDEESLIVVAGAVPGPKGAWIKIRDAVKIPSSNEVIWPGVFELKINGDESAELVEARV